MSHISNFGIMILEGAIESGSSCLTSPDFKRITGKLRLVKRRTRSKLSREIDKPQKSSLQTNGSSSLAVRSVNPFKSTSNVTSSLNTPSEGNTLCKTPERIERQTSTELCSPNDNQFVIPSTPEYDTCKRRRVSSCESDDNVSINKSDVTKVLPVDYSLCTKLRLTSEYDLTTLTEASHADESQALADFIMGQKESSLGKAFIKHLHYYTFPDLPWINLFPRTTSDKTKSSSLPAEAHSALKMQWKSAFQSAYNGLVMNSSNQSYFYMLCDSFTVLFTRCQKCEVLSAVVSPTTRGFRQHLQNKGIEFSLPISEEMNKNSPVSSCSTQCGSTDPQSTVSSLTDGNSVSGADSFETSKQGVAEEDPLEWLEDIGLEKSQFPSLRAAKVQMEEESFKKIDYRPSSTLCITGRKMLDKLKVFLTDYNKTISVTGSYANTPPTILSRKSFLNATIKKLEVRSGVLLDERGERQSYLDLIGPVLPGIINDLFTDVISTVPSHHSVHVHQVNLHNSYVCNSVYRTCYHSCRPDIRHSDSATSAFKYQGGSFYFTDVKKVKREISY
ncbi:DONSON [Bugula neritina]|uniref:DONSON n=1 Tax=Bugula neritina TaxID=10212 RepID=A0A7J7JC85_BUGNE|nr:DONSON [Bugula neritina]